MTSGGGEETIADEARTLSKVLPIALLVGLALSVGGVYLLQFQATLALRGAAARDEVVALEAGSSTGGSGHTAYFPVVSFETADGRAVTFRHRTGRRPAAYSVGDEVPVTYLPDSPQDALIDEGFANLLLPGILVIVGPALSILSLVGIRRAMRRLA